MSKVYNVKLNRTTSDGVPFTLLPKLRAGDKVIVMLGNIRKIHDIKFDMEGVIICINKAGDGTLMTNNYKE